MADSVAKVARGLGRQRVDHPVSSQPPASSGVDAAADAGLDIYSRLSKGKTVDVTGFGTLKAGERYRLCSLSLLTGWASERGAFGSSPSVVRLTIGLNQRRPADPVAAYGPRWGTRPAAER